MKKLFYFFAILMALYSLPSLAQGDPSPAVNMDKYITLTVQSGKDIRLNFKAPQANTPVRIVSGTNTQDITVGTDWFVDYSYYNDNYTVTSDGTTMTIYGELDGFICSYNQENLTSLDVSNNTQLTYLDCRINRLTSLDVSNNTQLDRLYCSDNGLTSLDVSNNTQLTMLECNNNQLTSLDVSNNTQLDRLYCSDNGLTSLDVSNNTQLSGIDCSSNQLTSLDVSNNTQLTWLNCSSNQLTSLDVSNNTQLSGIDCSSNQLTSLDVSNNTQLDGLLCYNNPFTTEALNKLYCSLPDRQEQNKGVISPLYKQDDANHAEIVAATSDNARAKNWEVKYYDWNVEEPDVPSNGNYECSNTNPTPNMSKYITLTVQSGKDIRLNFKAPQANTPVRIVSGTNTQDITVGTDWFVDFSIINDNYTVTSNDTTMTIYGELDGIDCSSNYQNLTSLDVSKNTQLATLDCHSNQLTSLDVSKNTQLTGLNCGDNKLTSLDVSKNTQLTYLNCHDNELTSLDVSNNTKLNKLYCYKNLFTTDAINDIYCNLNKGEFVSYDPERSTCFPLYDENDANHAEIIAATSKIASDKLWLVKYLVNDEIIPSNGDYRCPVPEVDTTKYISLSVVKGSKISLNFKASTDYIGVRLVSGTNIDSVKIGKKWYSSGWYSTDPTLKDPPYIFIAQDTIVKVYGSIDGFNCSSNQLTSLDVSKNTQLTYLNCFDNHLTSLDVSKNTQLTELYCSYNQLTSLDVSKNTLLTDLSFGRNQLTSFDVSKNTQLKFLNCGGNKFTTESMNELYCSLPEREEQNKGVIRPVYKQDDANHAEIVAATSDNARAKNWEAKYGEWNIRELNVPSNGNYDCNSRIDENFSSGISVFPNPATSKVQIQLSESVNETLILVDLTGRAVLLEDVVAGRANIDVSNLTAGTYFIRIGNITKKLTVK